MRKVPFVSGEFYHIYNRGTDRRIIFADQNDISRFLQSILEFNTVEPIGSIYENSFQTRTHQPGSPTSKSLKKLVHIISYCLNPNHFHFLLEQVSERGIEKFMHRLGTGYTKYFNIKHRRTGGLFQGRFKSVHVDSNEYLLHVSAYINLNDRVHQLGSPTSKLVASVSSWNEYIKTSASGVCTTDIILEQFQTRGAYKDFALSSLDETLERRTQDKEFVSLLIET